MDTDPQGSTGPNLVTQVVELKWNNTSTVPGQQDYPKVDSIKVTIDGGTAVSYAITELFNNVVVNEVNTPGSAVLYEVVATDYVGPIGQADWSVGTDVKNEVPAGAGLPELVEFPLSNIDDMRMDILEAVRQVIPFTINHASQSPYSLVLKEDDDYFYCRSSQEGLGIKTYQSDLFNNWISTESDRDWET